MEGQAAGANPPALTARPEQPWARRRISALPLFICNPRVIYPSTSCLLLTPAPGRKPGQGQVSFLLLRSGAQPWLHQSPGVHSQLPDHGGEASAL